MKECTQTQHNIHKHNPISLKEVSFNSTRPSSDSCHDAERAQLKKISNKKFTFPKQQKRNARETGLMNALVGAGEDGSNNSSLSLHEEKSNHKYNRYGQLSLFPSPLHPLHYTHSSLVNLNCFRSELSAL